MKARLLLRYSFFLYLLLASFTSPLSARVTKLRFLHFNDIYQLGENEQTGSIASLKAMIAEARKGRENVIVSFGGDFMPAHIGDIPLNCQQSLNFIEKLNFDFAVFGNHEFDKGPEGLKTCLKDTKALWFATNILYKGKQTLGEEIHIKEINGLKVGFFGLLTPETTNLSFPSDEVTFEDPVKAAKRAVSLLKEQGADLIVAYTHLRLKEDRELVQAVPEINLILGGHDHTPITLFENNVMILKAGSDGQYLALVDLIVNRNEKGQKPRIIFDWCMKSSKVTKPERALKLELDTFIEEAAHHFNEPVGLMQTSLTSLSSLVRARETALGNLVTDAMKDFHKADISFINGSAIRGNLEYSAGTTFTRLMVMKELPFDNKVVLSEITGSDLLKVLEHSISHDDAFLQVAGISFAYAAKAPKGRKIKRVLVAGKPLHPKKRYKIATLDFILEGGLAFPLQRIKKALSEKENLRASEVMIDYLKKKKIFSPKIEGRIKALGLS